MAGRYREGPAREHARARLDALRTRGFSVSTRTQELDAFISALDRRAVAPGAVDDGLLQGRIRQLEHDPVDLAHSSIAEADRWAECVRSAAARATQSLILCASRDTTNDYTKPASEGVAHSLDDSHGRITVTEQITSPVSLTATDAPGQPAPTPALEELYRGFEKELLVPLWTEIGDLMPLHPCSRSVPYVWRWEALLALADRAGHLVPVGRGGERRAIAALRDELALSDDGFADAVEPGRAAARYTSPTTGGDVLPTVRAEMHRIRGPETTPQREADSSVFSRSASGPRRPARTRTPARWTCSASAAVPYSRPSVSTAR